MNVALILAPYDSGHHRAGMGLGPEALLAGGLRGRLEAVGHHVELVDIGRAGDDQGREIATGFAVCSAVAEAASAARAGSRFPVVLAGNCLTAAGAVAGEGAEAICWFDQHGDLNTPETSGYGFLDGMALATVLGLCWRPMAATIPGFRPIDPAHCLLVDARDLDPDEVELLEEIPVSRVETGAVADSLASAGAGLATHIHVDLDIHDPRALRVNRYGTAGGPGPAELRAAVSAIARARPVCGITLSAYDPAYDLQARVPAAVADLLADFLSAMETAL
ncbi:arginase family protein [Rhodobium gokarnense]|uniref:Arginase n=1 Tax=Rhodobium gokarnense TaxID=364296 RepID=A0ABT3HEF0_9HYPH|nr:arginase family protein [Rhodobium gokarnense]MCW2308704.1 arginase [Rhodobium gokarnense]